MIENENFCMYKIKDSPLTLVMQENKWVVALGKCKISEEFETIEEALIDSKRQDLVRLIDLMAAINHLETEIKETPKLKKVK